MGIVDGITYFANAMACQVWISGLDEQKNDGIFALKAKSNVRRCVCTQHVKNHKAVDLPYQSSRLDVFRNHVFRCPTAQAACKFLPLDILTAEEQREVQRRQALGPTAGASSSRTSGMASTAGGASAGELGMGSRTGPSIVMGGDAASGHSWTIENTTESEKPSQLQRTSTRSVSLPSVDPAQPGDFPISPGRFSTQPRQSSPGGATDVSQEVDYKEWINL